MTQGISLPILYLTDFGGIVFDKIEINDTKYYIIHVTTLKPIDIEQFIKELCGAIFEVLKSVTREFRKDFRSWKDVVLLSGRIPMVIIPCLIYNVAMELFYSDIKPYYVYIFDPKLRKACNYNTCIEIPEEIVSKLISEYDEIVKQRHSMQ